MPELRHLPKTNPSEPVSSFTQKLDPREGIGVYCWLIYLPRFGCRCRDSFKQGDAPRHQLKVCFRARRLASVMLGIRVEGKSNRTRKGMRICCEEGDVPKAVGSRCCTIPSMVSCTIGLLQSSVALHATHVDSSIWLPRLNVENENNGRSTALLDSSGIIRERRLKECCWL